MIEDDKRVLQEGKPIEVEEEFNGRFYTTAKFRSSGRENPLFWQALPWILPTGNYPKWQCRKIFENFGNFSAAPSGYLFDD